MAFPQAVVQSVTAGQNVGVTGTAAKPIVGTVQDAAAADIKAVGQAGAAGASGKIADASHIHQGVSSLVAGTGITVTGGDGAGHGALTIAAGAGLTVDTFTQGADVTLAAGPPSNTAGTSIMTFAMAGIMFGMAQVVVTSGFADTIDIAAMYAGNAGAFPIMAEVEVSLVAGETKTIPLFFVVPGGFTTVYIVGSSTSAAATAEAVINGQQAGQVIGIA